MEHPNDEKLERYVRRQIAAAEMSGVILHLEGCVECAIKVQNLSAFENQSAMLLIENDTEVFHLDYDEHLRPFVDHEADTATREIVETHTQACSACAFELRELRQFAESLRLREIEKSQAAGVSIFQRAAQAFSRVSQTLARQIAIGGIIILLLAAVIWLTFGSKQTNNKLEVTQITNTAPDNRLLPVNSPTHDALPLNNNSAAEKTKTGNSLAPLPPKSISPVDRPNSKAIPSESKKIEVDKIKDLPEQFRENIRAVMSSERLTIPAKLDEMTALFKPRGNSIEKSADISPDRVILRESKPKFKWKADALKNESCVVEIYDENNNSVGASAPLKKNYWVPEKALEPGKSYQWLLRTAGSNTSSSKTVAIGKFSILDNEAQTKLKNLKIASPLLRGIIFASQGLIKDARREFKKAAANSAKSPARKFLRQLAKYP